MILTATGDETGYYPTAFINERDGSEMVLIRAGNFLRGSREGEGEIPLHTAYLPDFYISRNPITNEQFRLFVRWTQHKVQGDWTEADVQGMEKHPVVNISWYDAMNYCHWAGLRLPTEPEWEKAARGEDGREYPWGNTFEPGRGNFSSSGTMPVGLYVSGASPYGIRDMAGNVWEWVDDWYLPEDGPIVRTYRVLCGGSWRCLDKNEFKVTSRDKNVPDCWAEDIGFRAARYLDTD
jgi:formylglycine-generating enzyme required for sulfatase activity